MYCNLVAQYKRLNKSWLGNSAPSHLDSWDIQIQALRTELNSLKNTCLRNTSQQAQPQPSGQQQTQQTNPTGQNGYFIDPWHQSKTKGDTCFVDGKQWWWCPEHKRQNNFDGLYVTH